MKRFQAGWSHMLHTPAIRAVRQGLVSIIPILMIGAFALVLKSLPIAGYQTFLQAWGNGLLYTIINAGYNVTFGMLSVYMTAAIGYHYAVLKNQDMQVQFLGAPIVSLCGLFLLSGVNSLSPDTLGPKGMFVAILSALSSSALYSAIAKRQKRVSLLGDGADVRLSNAIRAILPTAVTVFLLAELNQIILTLSGAESVHKLMIQGASAIFRWTGTGMLSGILFVVLSSVMWFFGIHGSDMLEGVSAELFAPAIDVNTALAEAGKAPTEILTKPFFDVFVLMGGCGSAMCLLLAIFLFSKRRSNRSLARMAALPMLFNINEIMIFGLPVIYNPILFIPFLSVPLVCFLVSYFAMWSGLVPMVTSAVEWTTPIFFGGYIATGSFAGVLLQLINVIIGTAIYRPFVLRYDREKVENSQSDYELLTARMKQSEEDRQPVQLTEQRGTVGTLAKALMADLQQAVAENALLLHYQPQYRLDGSCFGAEALTRWNHPILGNIYPPLIFQLAQEGGFLSELEQNIVRQAMRDAKTLYAATGQEIELSANVTGISIQKPEFEQFLMDAASELDTHGKFCVELTEQAALQLDDALMERFARLRRAGYRLAIDDFSMGHTSLQYLQSNHFDMVKLDGSMVREALHNERCREIISSIVHLANSLEFDVLAEFVSSTELRDCLADIGCTLYQGWLYSPAIPLEQFIRRLKQETVQTAAVSGK